MPAAFPYVKDGPHGDVPINFYPAANTETGVLLQPTPGLSLFATLPGCTEVRGLYTLGDYMIAVARRGTKSPVWRINSIGVATEIGEIDTSYTGRIYFADNPTQLCICDGFTSWVYTPSSGAVVKITNASFPGSGGVTYQDSYGLFFEPDTTKWFFSGVYNFNSFDALDNYTQRARNDTILAIISHRQQVWLIGEKAYEVWYNAGGDNSTVETPTFALYKDGVYDVGIGAPATITDMQGAAVTWLSNRKDLIMSQGVSPVAKSNGMFSRELATYSKLDDANAFSYVDEGHTFLQINFPSADKTWCFDATTESFFKKQSFNSDGSLGRHRGNCYAYFNNKHYVGDYNNGKVYEMAQDVYDDNGTSIRRELYTTNRYSGIQPVRHPPLMIITEPGVGLSGEEDPQIMLRYSNTNGKTWSSEIWKGVGKIGEYGTETIFWKLGSSRRRMEHFAMTDPVLWRVLAIDNGGQK